MKSILWFDRTFAFGLPAGMLPFYLERLDGTIARLHQKTINIPELVLSQKLGGKWSVKENIGHLSEANLISGKRVEEILQQAEVLSPAVGELRGNYNDQPIREVIEIFAKVRKANIKRFELLTDDDKTKSSLHPRLKLMITPVDLALFDAEHDDHHLVRINEIISALT
ncbi:MAG: DinB family protein [Chryseolinea sp.]